MLKLVPVLGAIQEDVDDGPDATSHGTQAATLAYMASYFTGSWYTELCEEARLLQGIAGFRCLEDMSWWWAEKSSGS